MRKLRSIFAAVFLGLGIFCLIGQVSAASKYGLQETAGAAELPTTVANANSVEGLVGEVVNIILSVMGIIFFVLIFYAGFNWMTARGNGEKIEKSKETIESALIGLIVVLAAYAITSFVFDNLSTGSGTNDPDAACHAVQGTCGLPSSCTSAVGQLQSGLCSGGADNVCCVPN